LVLSENWDVDLSFDARQRRETFARFGLAAYHAQCVERGLAILLLTSEDAGISVATSDELDAFLEREFAKTMGRLVKTVASRVSIEPDLEARLCRALNLRNWLMHRYFWEHAWNITDAAARERMINELQETTDFLAALDDELTEITLQWLERSGISRATVDAMLERMLAGGNA
jgi:hypothetical protein